MNTHLLKYAVEVEKTGSFSKAAENFYINQPRLSKAIRELEKMYGIIIFNRTSKGVVPTKNGEIFLDYAKKVLSQLDELEVILRPVDNTVKRFDVTAPRASYVSYAFTEFLKKFDSSELKIDYRETNSMRSIKNVANGENNLGIIRYQAIFEKYFMQMLDEKNLKSVPITNFSYNLLMSKLSPLANCESITAEMLTDYIEITHGDVKIPSLPASRVKQIIDSEGAYKKRVISVYERASQFEILREIPDSFVWISPLPENFYAKEFLTEKQCSFENNLYCDILIYRRDYKLTEVDKLFVKTLKEVLGLS